ncbi:hypothetical protein [Novosphingobium album (ex Liu et al. 2023)]|uniref:CsbD family protein n=1 Tax=Novosphingobium album (ex Liu et al. 2023) TaxID=3031130 RepID=A0ABT5WUA7_9SPHN|nr:hypothetical protein [Novosphingobium album (ex Liu et al. 2023)]MDE8653438.1 hypothetical protein [Novosphingobium album (ex Liu et al. 2023)]
MGIAGEIKEAAGAVTEEMYGHGKSPEARRKAQEGRDLRHEGRVEDGKSPQTTPPGTDATVVRLSSQTDASSCGRTGRTWIC